MYSPAQSPQGYNTTPATPYQPTQHAPELSPYQSPNQIPQPSPYSPQSPQSPPGPHNSRGMADYSQQSPQPLLSPAHQHHGPPSDGLAPGKWHESYCGCCSPFDLCCVTWWCPCFTFGKTHHRLRAGNNMERYETCNSSCWIFCGAMCFGVHWIPMLMQRGELREKYGIDGNCCADCCSACCCPQCDLVQSEKEAKLREGLRGPPGQAVLQQYQPQGGMAMPSPTYHNEK